MTPATWMAWQLSVLNQICSSHNHMVGLRHKKITKMTNQQSVRRESSKPNGAWALNFPSTKSYRRFLMNWIAIFIFVLWAFLLKKYINMSLYLRVTHVTCHIAKDELTKNDLERPRKKIVYWKA